MMKRRAWYQAGDCFSRLLQEVNPVRTANSFGSFAFYYYYYRRACGISWEAVRRR